MELPGRQQPDDEERLPRSNTLTPSTSFGSRIWFPLVSLGTVAACEWAACPPWPSVTAPFSVCFWLTVVVAAAGLAAACPAGAVVLGPPTPGAGATTVVPAPAVSSFACGTITMPPRMLQTSPPVQTEASPKVR